MTSSATSPKPISRKEQLILWKANKQKNKQPEKENQEMSQSPTIPQKTKTTARKVSKARVKLVKSRVFSARPLNSDPKKLEIKRRFPSKEKTQGSIGNMDALTVKEMMQREIEMMKQNNITLQNHLAANIQRIKNLEAFTQKIDSLGERPKESSTSSEDEKGQKNEVSDLSQKMKKRSELQRRHSTSSLRIEVIFNN
jgi:hypothetical protein